MNRDVSKILIHVRSHWSFKRSATLLLTLHISCHHLSFWQVVTFDQLWPSNSSCFFHNTNTTPTFPTRSFICAIMKFTCLLLPLTVTGLTFKATPKQVRLCLLMLQEIIQIIFSPPPPPNHSPPPGTQERSCNRNPGGRLCGVPSLCCRYWQW